MGPVSIEGYYDEAFAVPGLVAEVRKGEAQGYAGYVVACFDDTGVDAARCVARGPVLGIAEAAMHVATMIAGSFTIVSTLGRSGPALEHLVHKYGFDRRCRNVRTAEVPVLALEEPGSGAVDRLRALVEYYSKRDGKDIRNNVMRDTSHFLKCVAPDKPALSE